MERRWEPRGRGAACGHGAAGERAHASRARTHAGHGSAWRPLAQRVGWSFRRTRAAGGKPVGSNPHPGAHINLEPRTPPLAWRARCSVLDRAGLLARRLPRPPTFPSARLSGMLADSSGSQQRGLRRNGRSRTRRTTSPDFPFHPVLRLQAGAPGSNAGRSIGEGGATTQASCRTARLLPGFIPLCCERCAACAASAASRSRSALIAARFCGKQGGAWGLAPSRLGAG